MSDQLPEYQCHKRVRAAKILWQRPLDAQDEGARAGVVLELEGGFEREVSYGWLLKHNLSAEGRGGYFVEYADGHTSWSPAAAFEQGYKRATDR